MLKTKWSKIILVLYSLCIIVPLAVLIHDTWPESLFGLFIFFFLPLLAVSILYSFVFISRKNESSILLVRGSRTQGLRFCLCALGGFAVVLSAYAIFLLVSRRTIPSAVWFLLLFTLKTSAIILRPLRSHKILALGDWYLLGAGAQNLLALKKAAQSVGLRELKHDGADLLQLAAADAVLTINEESLRYINGQFLRGTDFTGLKIRSNTYPSGKLERQVKALYGATFAQQSIAQRQLPDLFLVVTSKTDAGRALIPPLVVYGLFFVYLGLAYLCA